MNKSRRICSQKGLELLTKRGWHCVNRYNLTEGSGVEPGVGGGGRGKDEVRGDVSAHQTRQTLRRLPEETGSLGSQLLLARVKREAVLSVPYGMGIKWNEQQ